MSRVVRQIEIVRAMKAAQKAGLTDFRVEVDAASGRVIILAGAAARAEDDSAADARNVVLDRLKAMAGRNG